MKFKTMMVIKAVVCLGFGVLILIVPDFVYGMFGMDLTDAARVPARQYGASLIGVLLITWFGRNMVEVLSKRVVALGLTFYDALGFVVALVAVLGGVMNALGWSIVVLYLLLAIGFGYFWLNPSKP